MGERLCTFVANKYVFSKKINGSKRDVPRRILRAAFNIAHGCGVSKDTIESSESAGKKKCRKTGSTHT